MGKKRKTTWSEKRKNAKKMKPDDGQQQEKGDVWKKLDYTIDSSKFEKYYKKQFHDMIKDEVEFELFIATLKQKLPVTFRVSPLHNRYETLIDKFNDPHFFESFKIDEQEVFKNKKELVPSEQIDQEERVNEMTIEERKEKALEQIKDIKIDNIQFYPNNLLFQLTVPRSVLKKNPFLDSAHKFIQKGVDSGLISRQEIVSMLPPLLLQIEKGNKIFDMCAAPGSKTAQLLEILQQQYNQNESNDSVVLANDADFSRGYMLTHQLQRLNTAGMMVINHFAQNFPTLYKQTTEIDSDGRYESRLMFDRILCDVPCSSDAAIRKLPTKWNAWSTADSIGLHPLQLKIVMRGLSLLKVGGLLSYSTCSLNPVENEAVVVELLSKYGESIELVDCSHLLKNFKYREGLTKWYVLDDYFHKKKLIKEDEQADDMFVEYKTYDEVPQERRRLIKESMFCYHDEDTLINRFSIKRCVRIMPHDQDTNLGGFFIAVFRKTKDLEALSENEQGLKLNKLAKGSKEEEIKAGEKQEAVSHSADKEVIEEIMAPKEQINEDEEEEKIPSSKNRNKPKKKASDKVSLFVKCSKNDPDIEYISSYYGLTPDFPFEQLVSPSENFNKILFISKGVRELLDCDKERNKINVINMGVLLFIRNKSKFSNTECIYRISQDGVHNILPYLTKRVITCDQATFLSIVSQQNVNLPDIEDEALRIAVTSLSCGNFVLKTKIDDKIEAVTAHRHPASINIMVSRENLNSFSIRYNIAVQ